MPRAHVSLDLSDLSLSLRLTPGEVRHPLLTAISDSGPDVRRDDGEPPVVDEDPALADPG